MYASYRTCLLALLLRLCFFVVIKSYHIRRAFYNQVFTWKGGKYAAPRPVLVAMGKEPIRYVIQ